MNSIQNYKLLLFLSIILEVLGALLITIFRDNNNSIGIVFIAVGALFFIISIKNKDRWKKA